MDDQIKIKPYPNPILEWGRKIAALQEQHLEQYFDMPEGLAKSISATGLGGLVDFFDVCWVESTSAANPWQRTFYVASNDDPHTPLSRPLVIDLRFEIGS